MRKKKKFQVHTWHWYYFHYIFVVKCLISNILYGVPQRTKMLNSQIWNVQCIPRIAGKCKKKKNIYWTENVKVPSAQPWNAKCATVKCHRHKPLSFQAFRLNIVDGDDAVWFYMLSFLTFEYKEAIQRST